MLLEWVTFVWTGINLLGVTVVLTNRRDICASLMICERSGTYSVKRYLAIEAGSHKNTGLAWYLTRFLQLAGRQSSVFRISCLFSSLVQLCCVESPGRPTLSSLLPPFRLPIREPLDTP